MLGRPGGFGGAVGLVRFTVSAFALLAPAAIFFGARTAAPAAFFAAAGLVLAFGGAFLGAVFDAMAQSVPGAGLGVEPDWGALLVGLLGTWVHINPCSQSRAGQRSALVDGMISRQQLGEA